MMADPKAENTEKRLLASIGGEYGLERMKGVPAGTVHSIFKAWGKKKGMSIQQIYQKAGKSLDVTKVPAGELRAVRTDFSLAEDTEKKAPTGNEYVPLVVSKKRRGLGSLLGSDKIGVIFVPVKGKEPPEALAFAFKGFEGDFTKIGEAGSVKLVRVDEELAEGNTLACDELYYNIRKVLRGWGYLVKNVDSRKIRGIIKELRANEKSNGGKKKIPAYSHYYTALLVSVKEKGGLLFSAEKKVCILLIPRVNEMHGSSVDIVEFEGSGEAMKIKKLLGKLSDSACPINFVVSSAPKDLEIPE